MADTVRESTWPAGAGFQYMPAVKLNPEDEGRQGLAAMRRLSETVGDLVTTISLLEERLDPYCRPAPRAPLNPPESDPAGSEFTRQLKSKTYELLDQITRVNRIMKTFDL